jgi:transposase-like protein
MHCPKCKSTNIQLAKDYHLNKCLSCHLAFDNESAEPDPHNLQITEQDIKTVLTK